MELKVGDVVIELAALSDAELPLKGVEIELRVNTEDELRDLVKRLGGIQKLSHPEDSTRLLAIYGAQEGDDEIDLTVHVWLEGDLVDAPVPRTLPAIARLLTEAEAEPPAGYVSPPEGVSPGENEEYPAGGISPMVGTPAGEALEREDA